MKTLSYIAKFKKNVKSHPKVLILDIRELRLGAVFLFIFKLKLDKSSICKEATLEELTNYGIQLLGSTLKSGF